MALGLFIMTTIRKMALPAFCFFCTGMHANGQSLPGVPQLVKTNGVVQLVVDHKSFLILGGETGNSSASDMGYMRPYWSKLRAMNLNTLLVPCIGNCLSPKKENLTWHW